MSAMIVSEFSRDGDRGFSDVCHISATIGPPVINACVGFWSLVSFPRAGLGLPTCRA